MSTKSLQEKLGGSQKLLVVSKFEDPETMKQRRQMVQSRSVSELSQISGWSDIPLPSRVEKLLESSMTAMKPSLKKSKSGDNVAAADKDYYQLSPMAIHDTIYSTLPRSMKSELLVKSRVEKSADVVQARRHLVQSKSIGELSQVRSLSDLPIPSTIENFLKKKSHEAEDDASSQCTG